jgi:uncharacterized membrane protein
MRKWIPLLIIAAAFGASAIVYPMLPATIPTHWNLAGHPDKWSSRAWGAWMLPVFILGAWALTRVLPAIDPRGANYAKFGSTFEGIVISIMLFMLALHIVVLRASLGYPVDMRRVVPIGIGLVFVVIGNLLPRARPNWFVGIRTPWTLSSDRVWEKTHRFGGRVFVAAGILMTLAGLFAVQWAHVVAFTAILVTVAAVLVYSYLEWKREQSSGRLTN